MFEGRKLLLADDSLAVQKVIDLTFTDEGMHVTTVSDGQRALEQLDLVAPDVVLADVFMPGINGYELCTYIKTSERFRQIPVMLLIGSFEPFDEAEARQAGADDIVTKPFQSIRELVSRVGSLLSGKTAQAKEEPPFGSAETAPLQPQAEPEPEPEPEPRVFVEAASMKSDEAQPVAIVAGTDTAEGASVGGAACVADLELQTADTVELSPLAVEAPSQDDTIEVEPVMDSRPAVVAQVAEVSSNGAPGMSNQLNQWAGRTNADVLNDSVLELGSGFAPRAFADDFALDLDLDYEEPASEPAVAYTDSVAEERFETAAVEVMAEEPSLQLSPEEEAATGQWAVVSEPSPSVVQEPPPPVFAAEANAELSAEVIDAIARRVVEQLSDKVVREIAWEVVPELAELLVKQKLAEQK